jgi:hypothetical protein
MIVALYRQFSQGIAVAGCGLISFSTLSYIMCDSHKINRKMLINQYEEKINKLNIEIEALKLKNNLD